MSLYEPIPQADLSPQLPDSDKLTWREWEDYGHLFVWVFWRPHSLTSYLRRYKRYQDDLYSQIVGELYLLAFCLTQLLVAFVSIGYWAMLTLVSALNGVATLPIGDLFVSLIAGMFVVLLVQATFWVINENFFGPEKRTDMTVATMIVLGLVAGTTAGIYYADSFAGDFLFRVALLSAGVGSAIGLTLSTLTYYIKIEATQRSFIFTVLSILAFIVFVTIFGGFLTRSFSFMVDVLICLGFSFIFTALRIDDWMLGQLLKSTAVTKRDPRKLPRVTPIPIIGLRLELEDWLDWDWQNGLKNIRDIREYTRQDPMTSLAIRQILKESSEEKDKRIVSKIEQLQKTFSNMDLRHFSPAKLSDNTPRNVVRQSVSQLVRPTTQRTNKRQSRRAERQKHRQRRRTREQYRVKLTGSYDQDLLADAAIAGYSYLNLNHPDKAVKAFEKVDHDELGKEMAEIAKALNILWYAEKLPEKAPLVLPKKPDEARHEETWKTFTRFQEIVRYVWLLRRTRDDNFAIVYKLIQDKLRELKENLPDTVEGQALKYIAEDWTIEAANLSDTVEHSDKVKQVENPYIFAEPLSGRSKELLMGRNDQLDLIKAAWKVGNFQPLLIFGQRHMGKTSLIRCADAQFSTSVRMAYVNLRQVEVKATATDLFLTICDAVGELRIHPGPTPEQLIAAPYREFRQYIHECATRLGSVGLVIVLDELEHLMGNVALSSVLKESIQQLWTLSQLDPNLGVILITTHNPAELMNDNDHSLLTSSIQPVEVGYLEREHIAPLLRTPSPKFLPYCTDEGLDRFLFWTAGQPYLTQLLAYYLIEHYNAQVSSLDGRRDPLFTAIDVDGAVQRNDFRHQCERYFRDILEEAVSVDGSAIDILDALSEKRMGLMPEVLKNALAGYLDRTVLNQLEQHQIIRYENGRWRIVVELFRWWLRGRNRP